MKVYERWNNSFENFYADMGPCPDGMSIDRFPNNDGNYEPGNCRWATAREQVCNTRRSHFIEYGGRKMNLKTWSRELGIHITTIRSRILAGHSTARCLGYEPIPNNVFGRLLNGEFIRSKRKEIGLSQKKIAESVGLHQSQWGDLETGKKLAMNCTLTRVAKALRCEVADLLTK